MSKQQAKSLFEPKPLQQAAIDLVKTTKATNLLFYGGGRSGKSIAICYMILMRALTTPGSRHGIFRRSAVAAKDTLFKVAFRKACELTYGPGFLSNPKNVSINKEEMSLEFSNGSVVGFYGFDDNNRDRILGQEFDTIWMNECTEFEYDDFETLSTRLSGKTTKASGSVLKPLFFLDLNPDLDTHFTYQIWIKGIDPARNMPLEEPEDYASLQINLAEDDPHISDGYLKRAKRMSDEKVQRFVKGYWRSEREYSMFKPSIVNGSRIPIDPKAPIADRLAAIPELVRIGVNVDPAVSSHEKSDEHGITVTGIDAEGIVYVLADYSLKGAPTDWAVQVAWAYKAWGADFVVIEKNQGGDLVKEPLRHIAPHLPIREAHASRGKVIRAEPVSILYQDGRVKHVGEHPELERQMYAFHSSYDRKKSGSPDRLDSLVWGVIYLTEKAATPKIGSASTSSGFWRP